MAVLVGAATTPVAQEPAPSPPEPTAQEERPVFPAQVEQVIVDAVVTDKKGNPVTGLTPDDLTVTEDGVAQTITSFEAVQLPPTPAEKPPPRPPVSRNTGLRAKPTRAFVVIFDDINLTPPMAQRAKAAVADFLANGVREGDRVTLIATGGAAWWTTRMEEGRDELIAVVKRLDGRYIPDTSRERMSDWEALRIYIHRDPQVVGRVQRRFDTYGAIGGRSERDLLRGETEDPFVFGRAADVYYQSVARNRVTLDVLERSLNALATARGRKSVILISQGFIYDPNLDEFKRVSEASRRANAAIYFVNARGLEGLPAAFTAQFGPALPTQDLGSIFGETFEAATGAEALAADSGGFTVRNTNDLSVGIRKIADESRSYYLLGYIPTNTARDGSFRKIKVKVPDRKGLEVRARKGYYAPTADGESPLDPEPGTDPVLQRAFDSPYDIDDIPLRMTHFVGEERLLGQATVKVVTEVDVRSLELEEKDGRYLGGMDFLLVVTHRETGEFFRYDQKIDMKLLPATRERLSRHWYPILRSFDLRPGGYQAKIVVRGRSTRRVGTVVHAFEVPELDGFRVSTPVLSDLSRQAGAETPSGSLAMLARRDFPQGASLFCQVEVFGAARDGSGMPKVSLSSVVYGPDGTPYTSSWPSVIEPTSLGKVSRRIGISLRGAGPGPYRLVLSFRDELSGKVRVLTEPFTVTPKAGG